MMYKLEKGKLVTPPVVWKGMVGYNNNLERLTADGWKPLIKKGEGEIIEYFERADYIEELHSNPPYNYREERAKAYPSLGDMIDAICKAYEGDDTELQSLMQQRNTIKAKIKKTQNAD